MICIMYNDENKQKQMTMEKKNTHASAGIVRNKKKRRRQLIYFKPINRERGWIRMKEEEKGVVIMIIILNY